MTENWDKICRMCSHQTEVLDSLFEKQRNVYLPDIIKEAFGLQVLEYDNLPTKICKSCTTRILFIEDSRQEFLKNDMKLRKILAQNINIEMVPIEDPADGPSPISSRVKVEVDEDVLMRESFVNSMNDNNHPPPGIKVQHSNSHEGHHSEQHFGENNEVKSFLAKTGLLNLLQAFEKHEIEYENIALLTEKHIEAITPIANRQINLRKAIQKYFYQQNAQYTVVELEETQSPARPQHVTLDKICAYSEVGKKFLDYYQQHKTYDDVYRDYLARAVVDYYYQNNSKFFDSTYKEMTKIITDYLPNELPETWYYCDSDQRTGGKLYLRYSYITRPIRKAGCSKMARTKRSMEADKDFDIDKQKRLKHQLQVNLSNEEKIYENWEKTYQLRRSDMLANLNIQENWPILSKFRRAELLINSDFGRIHPEKQLLLYTSFDNFAAVFREKYKMKIIDEECLNSLKIIENRHTEVDHRNFAIIYSLCYVLSNKDEGPLKKYKQSVLECRDSFLTIVKNKDHVQHCIAMKRTHMEEYCLQQHPYMIAVETENLKCSKYFISYENILLSFDKIVTALDYCFKMHAVFNVEYSPECYNIWQFIQQYFYQIKYPTDVPNRIVAANISDF